MKETELARIPNTMTSKAAFQMGLLEAMEESCNIPGSFGEIINEMMA
jgi:hypothetical protein